MTNGGRGVGPGGLSGDETSRRRLWAEVLIVLGLSLGASAAYSIVNLLNLLTQQTAISHQTATLNPSQSSRPTFDLIYQLMGIFFALMPVALVCFLLWRATRPHLGRLGIDLTRPGRDSLQGLALAVIIGGGGIAVYLGGRSLGITVNVIPTALDAYWWTVPVLILSAVRAALQEEVIVIGYLFARLREIGWGKWRIIIATAVLRGSYHLYQGVGAFIGNVLMGLLFGWLYQRYGRLMPFVVAHALIDAAIFVGYPWAAATFPALF